MKQVLIAVLFGLLSAGLAFAGGAKESDDGKMMKKDDSAMMKQDDGMAKKDNGMMKTDTSASFYDLKGLGSQVVGFTTEQAAMDLAKTQTVVYFFAASWCPDCKATMKDISANFSMIPKTTTIVVVDYDKAGDLKKKYGITMQHTFVVIDPQGMKKNIWNGAMTVKDILSKSGSMM